MIAWLHPAALWGLLAVAGPILVHLLRRRHARRVVLPSTRFVVAHDDSAFRVGDPSDFLLLLIRIGIVTCAALALARPLLVNGARQASWAQRTARAVVVDTSESIRGGIGAEVIEAEMASANAATLIQTDDLGGGLTRAAAWLGQSPPARREIAVLSDFQHGALTSEDVGALDPGIGLRLVRFPAARPRANEPVARIVSEGGARDVLLRLDGDRTLVAYRQATADDGLRLLLKPEDAHAEARLRRVLARAGARAPAPGQPIVVRFPGADMTPASAPEPADQGWTFGAAQRFLRSPLVTGINADVSSVGNSLVIDVNMDPRSLAAAQVLKAALDARPDPRSMAELETESLAEAQLAGWSRAPGPADVNAWRHSDESDGRWLWAAALVLLAIETLFRRAASRGTRVEEAHAA